MTSFGSRLSEGIDRHGRLCVGIDPHPWLLGEWDLAVSAAGAREFGMRVVDSAAGRVGIVKPQVAFFERFGSAGYAALEEVLESARAAGLLLIADVKRGDVGTSVDAYAEAWLTPGSPLEADAMTVSAYQGIGSLNGPRDLALAHGKGLFVLAATSNPEAGELQKARTANGRTVAADIVAQVADSNDREGADGYGSLGVVLGATVDFADYGIDLGSLDRTPILAPGFGHQGAKVDQFPTLYGAASGSVIVAVSRSILSAGAAGLVAAIESEAAACRA